MGDLSELRNKLGLNDNKSTTPFKTNAPSRIVSSMNDSKRRQEEEEKRRQEELKRKREEQARNAKLKAIEEMAHPVKASTNSGGGRGFDVISNPTSRAIDNLPQSNSRQAYKKWYEGEDVRKYKDYSNGLGEDVRNTIEYSRAAGLKDDEIKNNLIPLEDNSVEQRLEEIGSKLKPGKESWGQTMQEGWYEKELQNMLSKETLRQMNGLPNKADVIQKWMADNPELSISQDTNFIDKGVRFLAEGTKQQVDSYSAAAKNWESWAIAGAIVAGASLLAPVTGGGSLLVGGTLLGNATLALGSLGALKLGTSYGSMKHMSELEMTDKYNQYIQEGVHPEIAKKQAATVGAVNGIIEFMQIDSAFSTIPGVANLLDNGKKLAGKEFTKELTKIAANYGVDLLGNALEESAQEATGLMGLELSKYLENAPNPNTLEGLKVLAKTFDKEDYRERVIQSGMDALQSMWLSPIVSSGVRQGASMGVNSAITKSQSKKVNGYYTAEERQSQEFNDAQKKMLLTDTEENQIDMMIKDYNESRDERTLAAMVTTEQVLDAIAQREDTTNQERELIQKSRDKINNIVSKAMYDAKDENSDIEYRPTNNADIERDIFSPEFTGETYTQGFNEYAIERYNDAKNAGVLDTIKEELLKGTSKAEIASKITKALPRKMRGPLDIATMINAVESVQKEVNAQKVMNNIHNYDLIKDYKPTEVVEETQTEIEATEEPQTEVKGVSDTVVQTEGESPTESLAEPTNNIEVELGTDEVETDTNEETSSKFQTSDVVKVPINKIHVDADRFQFRYSGTTKKLDGATFNQDLSSPLMLWENEFGDLYVVNGHHRLRLAEQSGTQEVDAKIYTSQEYSDTAIRALGAVVNIAENNAEAIDVAKVLRDSTITTDELKKYVSPRSKVMKDGIALSNLNDWIFTQVATSKIPTDIGVVIGNELPGNKVGQNQIVKAIDKLQLQGKDITASILTEMVAEVKGTAQETYTEQTLFGEETFTKSVQYERASLVEYVKGQLKSKKSLLKSVTKDKNTSMLESLGNKIAADENTEQLEQSELALLLLDKTLNYQGTKVNKLFNDLALEYSQAEPKDRAAIKRKALDELISLMEGGNLLGENETTKSKRKASSIIGAIQDSSTDGERGQESSYDSEQIITEEQEEIAGQEALFALREQPQVEIIADDDVKNTRAYKSTIKIAEALQKNVLFNGLKVNYSNKSGKIVFESKKELKERGYEHYEVGKTYYIYGAYDNRTREITLNSEAARDTILEEAIHDIQSRIQEINPELGVTIQAWENEVREQAAELGYEIPGGYELLAQALVFSELGYASSNKDIANLIAVDDEIVVGMKAILGRDVLKEGQGLVESETAKKDRELKGMYENYAKRIFTQDGFLDNLLEAKENRKTEIRAELANARAATYYHPSNGQYVIVSPSTKGAKYQVTTFSPKFGPISDGQFDTIDEIADRLVENKFYYKANEIHYQLKQFTRGVVDELYGIAISRGYRTDNNSTTNRERISFQLNDTQIIETYHDAQIGNFSAQDFDELILHNNELEDRVKQTIIGRIRDAIDNGYDVPNSEVRIGQYLNRFYNIAMPTIKGKRLDLRIKGNKVELGVSGFQLDGEREFYEYDAYNTLEEAISDYKGNLFLFEEIDLDKALNEIVEKDFSYTVEMLRASKGITMVKAKRQVVNDIKIDYQEFRDNIETYRHKGLNYNFDMKPHYAISYQLKEATNIDTPEFKNWFKDSKVVGENGDPLVVYHGTPSRFEIFDINKIGDRNANYGKGFYFTSDLTTATDYALDLENNVEYQEAKKIAREKADIHESYDFWELRRQGKLDNATAEDMENYRKLREIAWEDYLVAKRNREKVLEKFYQNRENGIYEDRGNIISSYVSLQNPYILDAEGANYDKINPLVWEMVDANNWRANYDGIIIKNVTDAVSAANLYPIDVYIAFNPTQIKSIYNNGMFNEYDPNINYQLKESINNVDHYELKYGSPIYNNFVKDGIETNLVYKTEEQNGLSTLLVDRAVKNKEIHDMVIRDTVLGGYDYLKMGDKEPTLVTPKMIEKVLSEKPIFQIKEVQETNGNLLAMHNISKNKLKNAIKLGGFPMPSIAVAKKDLQYTDFGNITLLFDKDTIDPRASRYNKVYSGDAYTSVFPNVYYKVNSNVARRLSDMVHDKLSPELRDKFASPLDEDNISYKLERRGSFEEAYKDDVGLMIAYLNEKGIPFETATTEKKYGGWDYELLDKLADKFPVLYDEKYIDMNVANEIAPELTDIMNEHARETFKESFPDFTLFQETMEFGQIDRLARNVYEYVTDENRTVIDRSETEQNIKNAINKDDFSNWLGEISEGIIEKTGFRNDKDTFTPSGNRRKWEVIHDELTLDNILRAMRKEPEQAATGSSGIGQFMAVNSKEFKSIQHIRDSIDMLVDLDNEEFKELKDDYSNRLFNIANKIKNPRASNSFIALDNATDILVEVVRDNKTKPSIMEALYAYASDGYITLSNFSENELFDLVDDVQEMPTQYFEAKPQRAVRFNEVQAALIDVSRLEGFGEELEEINDMLKSVGVKIIETYTSRYEHDRQRAMDSILRQNDVSFQLKEADTTTKQFKNWFRDSKVTDEEGNPLVVYHGSPNTFTEFRPSTAPGWGKGIYFTDNAENATEYAYSKEGIKPLYEVYLNIQNPYTDETRLSDSDIEGTRAYKEKQSEVPMVDGEYEYYIDARELFGEDGEFANNVLRELGYDGIIYEGSNNIEGKEIVVFNPTQIKSVYNYGAWDVNDANIYYQLKEGPEVKERSWGQTVRDANLTEQWLSDLLTLNKFMYEVKHNEDTLIAAAKLIEDKGEEYIEARLLSDLDNDAVLMAASQILTYKYMESGEQDRAMAMLDKTAEKATSLGQAIQILSVWGRQTPEGMLRYTSQAFRKAMTDKDRQVILDKTKALTDEFNKLNRQAIKEIDLVGTIKQVQEMKPDERLARDVASRGETLANGFTPEMLKPFENTIDDDMAQRIIDVVNRHYQNGKGNLKDKLGDLGLNDFETEILDKYIKQKVKEATRDSKQAKIDKELKKQKYERKGIDEQILDLTSEGKIDENLLKNLVGEKEGMPVLNKELVDYIYQQGQYINSLPQGRERDIETGKMIQTISDQMPVSFWTKVKTFQTIAQLLNFKTTIRNLVGNDMFRRLDTFTLNFLGTPIDAALAKAPGHSRSMLFRPIAANKAQSLGYKEGWRLGLEDALLGINTSDENTQYDLRRNRTFTTGPLAHAETVMDIALRATDRAALMATFRDSLEEQMQLAGVDTATDEMTENAMAVALYRTFQDDSTLSKMFSSLKKSLNYVGFGGKWNEPKQFGLGEFILKYPKTPANILGRAIDYSPVGVVVTSLKLLADTSPKGSYLRQRMVAEGFSRAIMGTGLIATGAILARMGILTGSNPDDDEDIYKLEKQYGLRDFSVNVSALFRYIMSGFTDSTAGELRKGDRIASYDWAEPIAMGLAVGADTELGSGEAIDFLSTVVRAVEAGTTTLAEQPLLTGLSNLFRYGDITQGMTQVIKSMPSSFTPTLFSHVAQFLNGRDTDPYSFYGTGQQAWNLVQNRIPGLRGNIPSRYSVLGDEKRYYPEDQNLVTRALNTFLNPSITSKYMPTNEAQMIFDLYKDSGNPDIVPRPPQKTYTIDKVKYTFTPESWEEMSKWLGKRYRDEIGYAMNTYMKGWSAEEQADEIEWIIKEVKNEAREKAMKLGKKVD